MITYLFDANSLINLTKRGVLEPFAKGATIELALYESLSAIWKEFRLLKKINEQTAELFVEVLCGVFNVLEIISIKSLEKEVFKLASKEGLTIYDASYMYAAMVKGLTLVTDDDKLRNVASKYVKTVSSSDLLTSRS